ncbi:MAG TPA: hypothetical protein VGH80_06465 [Xanthomonadaceae bacterium]
MRKDVLTLLFAPLLLVSCSCAHKNPSEEAPQASAPTPAHAPANSGATAATSASGDAAPTGSRAKPDQALRLTLLDESSHQPVYHAGLNLAGSSTLQWTDQQGQYVWGRGGIAATGAINIHCTATRAETGRKLKSIPYAMKGPLTEVSATIDSSVCVEPPEKATTGESTGTFYRYYGHGLFVPCAGLPADASFYGNEKSAWVNFSTGASDEFAKLRDAASIAENSDQPMHVQWTGTLTGPGAYGERGVLSYKIDVAEVRAVSSDFPDDCPVRKPD